MAASLGIQGFEFSRTHWAVKSSDLFRVLYEYNVCNSPSPSIFSAHELNSIDNRLVSVMIPFSGNFDQVFNSIKIITNGLHLNCLRAMDIWENDAIIQDIVSLICRSRIVICDCTGRNPNVFYEAGIAHALGKSVILITQSANDIPFDLRHLRYLSYLPNSEGLGELSTQLLKRISTILSI